MKYIDEFFGDDEVAIPLEQGLFFNASPAVIQRKSKSRNPFGAGTIF